MKGDTQACVKANIPPGVSAAKVERPRTTATPGRRQEGGWKRQNIDGRCCRAGDGPFFYSLSRLERLLAAAIMLDGSKQGWEQPKPSGCNAATADDATKTNGDD